MTAAETNDNGGFQVQQSRNNKGTKKRIYIGNLPPCDNLKATLVEFLKEQAQLQVDEADVSIVSSRAALVACQDINRAIATLHKTEFKGNKLVVQRERKKRPNNNNTKKQSFGGRGWSQPKEQQKSVQVKQETTKVVQEEVTITEEKGLELFDNELELSQHVGSIVTSELKAANEDPSNGDVVNTVIASTAAMTLLSSTNAFGLDRTNEMMEDTCTEQPSPLVQKEAVSGVAAQNDFLSQSKKPLSQLLADYGEQDLDFKKVIPTAVPSEPPTKEKKREDYNNRLTLQGKAPIHVEVTSFGYIHGVPSNVRSGGWSHAHPLSPMDCRDLPQVPHYMARQDGLSPAVKRALLNARDTEDDSKRDNRAREYANDLGAQMFNALYEAISAGGHGPVSPLRMTVYVGSETGRHRGVVVTELAATALRKLLRANKDNRITQPVSVGTRHRDIERRQQRDSERRSKQSKQAGFESDW